MKRLEVSGAVRPLHGSLGVKGLISHTARRNVQKESCKSFTSSITNSGLD